MTVGNITAEARMDSYATAGYEESVRSALELLQDEHCNLIKTPWIYLLCEEASFNPDNISFVITPIREPFVSTISRSMNEIGHLVDCGQVDRALGMVNGQYPGAIVYKTSIDQQEALSNQCFTYLSYWCAIKKIPILGLPFPSAFENVDCMTSILRPVLSFYHIEPMDVNDWVIRNYSSKLLSASLSDTINPEIISYLQEFFSEKRPNDGLIFIKSIEKLINSYKQEINHLKNITKPHPSILNKLVHALKSMRFKRRFLN